MSTQCGNRFGQKERDKARKKHDLKTEKKLLPGSTCPNQNTRSPPVSSGAVLTLPHLTLEDSADSITYLPRTQTGPGPSTEASCSLWLVALGSSPPSALLGALPSGCPGSQPRAKFQVEPIEREISKC